MMLSFLSFVQEEVYGLGWSSICQYCMLMMKYNTWYSNCTLKSVYIRFFNVAKKLYFHLAITPLWYWMRSVLWCPWICPISWHLTRGSYSDQLSTACIRFNNVAQNQASLQNETTNSLNKDVQIFCFPEELGKDSECLPKFNFVFTNSPKMPPAWRFLFLATRTLCRFPPLGLLCVDAGCLGPDSKSVDGWHLILSTHAEQAVHTQMIQPCLRQIPILLHFCCSWLSCNFTIT